MIDPSNTDEIRFPECQYVANGVDPATAYRLGAAYRVGNSIEPIGHEAADRISSRLNQMQSENRRTALRSNPPAIESTPSSRWGFHCTKEIVPYGLRTQ